MTDTTSVYTWALLPRSYWKRSFISWVVKPSRHWFSDGFPVLGMGLEWGGSKWWKGGPAGGRTEHALTPLWSSEGKTHPQKPPHKNPSNWNKLKGILGWEISPTFFLDLTIISSVPGPQVPRTRRWNEIRPEEWRRMPPFPCSHTALHTDGAFSLFFSQPNAVLFTSWVCNKLFLPN